MKHISNTDPFREVDNRNNFMLVKQELKRYEKELELKAGKGFLNSNISSLDFHSNGYNALNNIVNEGKIKSSFLYLLILGNFHFLFFYLL